MLEFKNYLNFQELKWYSLEHEENMEVKERKELELAVYKRHIVSIGERLYTESVELLRELVNNAYDADATKAHLSIYPKRVLVKLNFSKTPLQKNKKQNKTKV